MQKKLNEDFIDSYCEKFAGLVSSGFFTEEKKGITGKEILKVTPSKQVNFFVIKLLFRHWQEEAKKLESPYFNYKHEEVRHAMVDFMNVLSQHIEVEQSHFELLLNHAVKETLYLAALPQAYVEIDLDNRGVDEIKDKTVEATIKYLKIYKQEIANFLSDMKGLTIDDVIEELPEEFDDFDTSAEVASLSQALSDVLEISPEKIYSDDPDIEDFEEEDLFETEEEDIAGPPLQAPATADEEETQEPEEVEISQEDEAMAPEPMPAQEAADLEAQGESSSVSEVPSTPENSEVPAEVSEASEDGEQEAEDTINKQFEKEEETLAEHLETQEKKERLLSLISLNNRYMFIRELFGEDKNEFENALFELEAYTSFDESVEYLVQTYAKHNEWDMQSDEVKEFLKVIFRRFR